jgi:hypothetical protein
MSEENLEQFFEQEENINLNEGIDLEELQETASFLKISELKLKCRAKSLRLKEDDIKKKKERQRKS